MRQKAPVDGLPAAERVLRVKSVRPPSPAALHKTEWLVPVLGLAVVAFTQTAAAPAAFQALADAVGGAPAATVLLVLVLPNLAVFLPTCVWYAYVDLCLQGEPWVQAGRIQPVRDEGVNFRDTR